MKKIAILGSTGSIGTQTLQVIDENNCAKVQALSVYSNISLAEKQIRKYKPEIVAVMLEDKAKELKIKVADTSTKIVSGLEGICECATYNTVDTVVTAVVGVSGLIPTISAIESGKNIALANKETLVAGGEIVMPLAKKNGVKILPVDSEHSAIFQSCNGDSSKIKKILLTASGGPFLGRKKEEIYNMTPEDALKHPNWSMGAKVTIDSSTLMNKGLEVIEARHLFDVEPENIQVIIQPQSIIHSMVEYQDNSVIAQLSTPDMKLPISYALTYPERKYCGTSSVDFYTLGSITFAQPDTETFPCLKYAFDAIKVGGTMPSVMNGANEIAVAKFLNGEIKYGNIPEIIYKTMSEHKSISNPSLQDILDADIWARQKALEVI
ncbi:MAG: 1-deoxy-D-xylulose-5-phosphate reductoisomerase [Clostridia bacterium]|nr:1-deoxy-D-xylulose-5-phosphate reductoisomerase [Clostridia bacterium]